LKRQEILKTRQQRGDLNVWWRDSWERIELTRKTQKKGRSHDDGDEKKGKLRDRKKKRKKKGKTLRGEKKRKRSRK